MNQWKWIFRLALREIGASKKFSAFFCLNLVLGLFGIIALGAFKDSLQLSMHAKSKLLLGADLSISSRRLITDSELKTAREVLKGSDETESLELFSMVQGNGSTRLAEIRAIQNAYPFYGGFTLSDGRLFKGGDAKDILNANSIWLSPELSLQLNAKIGDTISLGEAKFKVSGIVADDTSSSWTGFDLASPAWIGLPQIPQTGLVRPGSNVSYRHLFRLAPDQDLKKVAHELMAKLRDPGIRVTTHERASDQIGRILDYVNDYLGLVSLVALFFSAIGATFLFRSYLAEKFSEIAVLMTLGASPAQATSVFILQLASLGLIASVIATAVAGVILPLMGRYLARFLSVTVSAHLSVENVFVAFLLGTVGSVLICLPLLRKVSRFKLNELFSEAIQPKISLDRSSSFYMGLLAIIFWSLSCWQAKSWSVGSWFMAGFLGAAVFIILCGYALLSLISVTDWTHFSLRSRLAIRNLSRERVSTLSSFLALGLGAMLLTLVPAVQSNIEKELLAPSLHPLPSLFLFDIQDEQIHNLDSWAKDNHIELSTVTPMVRARLSAVNGKAFERDEKEYTAATREEEENARSKNRMFNLSYRLKLTDAETLTQGRGFLGSYHAIDESLDHSASTAANSLPLPEITLESGFASRLKLKLHDKLTFDVQGVDVSGIVVGIRRVNWMSFEPNFFITFQPGSLDDAPKTWLASIPPLSLQRKVELQKSLVQHFSNVSAVDVENTVSKILAIFVQVGRAIRVMAILTLLAGFAVLFSIANHQASSRKRETSLLKVLGAQFGDVQAIFQRETTLVALGACLFGAGLSFLFSYLMMEQVFEMPWHPDFPIAIYTVLSMVTFSWILSRFASRRALAVKPISLLQS